MYQAQKVEDYFESIKKWKHLYSKPNSGWFDYEDLYNMVCDKFNKGSFVEIGVWQGMSLSYLMLNAKHNDVWGVDTFKGDPDNPNEQRLIKENNFNLHEETLNNLKSLNLNPKLVIKDSIEAAKDFSDNQCSFVFIDGGHLYEQVKRDLEAWYTKVRFDGIIAGHDYNCYGVQRAVEEFFGKKSIKKWGNCWWLTR